LQALTNENGDRAVLYLNGEMSFRFQLSNDTASLHFEKLFGDCDRQLDIKPAGDRRIAIEHGRGKLQFSLDLLEWHDAGPDFSAADWTVPRRIFFREIY
jgi:hypothetical protein